MDAGAGLSFYGGTRNLNAGSNITGAGSFTVAGATVNVNNLLDIGGTGAVSMSSGALNINSAVTFGTLTLSGGTLGGTGNLTVSNTFNVTGYSTLTGSGQITTRGATNINMSTPSGYLTFTGGKSWVNEGTLTVGGDDFVYFGLSSGGTNTLTNAAGGTLNL